MPIKKKSMRTKMLAQSENTDYNICNRKRKGDVSGDREYPDTDEKDLYEFMEDIP